MSEELSAMQFLPDMETVYNSHIYFKLDTSLFTISALMKSVVLHYHQHLFSRNINP
jgi:hypothetical protein